MAFRRNRLAAALALLPFTVLPAVAQGWVAEPAQGGARMRLGGSGPSPEFLCDAAGRLTAIVPGNGDRFDPGGVFTVTYSIDGLGFMLSMSPRPGTAGDGFAATGPWAGGAALLDALARGKEVEIASPAGRTRLPLTGSARAVKALRAACED